jgi:hypothetical protein
MPSSDYPFEGFILKDTGKESHRKLFFSTPEGATIIPEDARCG